MTPTREQIRRAYIDACYQEIEALKPGNVHRFADGHRMNAEQFFESARISSHAVGRPPLAVGERILAAVTATQAKIETNTNLEILLLCVPLAKAAESGGDLQTNLAATLDLLDVDDARNVFAGDQCWHNPAGLDRRRNTMSPRNPKPRFWKRCGRPPIAT